MGHPTNTSNPSSPVVRYETGGFLFLKPKSETRLRLFCFPYAGGRPTIFHRWQDALPSTIELCPIQLHPCGTQGTVRSFNGLSSLVQAIARDLLPYLDRPFAFFGHSMGALVSFEVARWLRGEYNRLPIHLFVSGREAPHLSNSGPPIHALPEPKLLEELKLLNGTPQEILQNSDWMKLVLPILRADLEICETYTYFPEPPLDCPMIAFGGLEDNRVGRDQLEAWRSQTRGSFSLRMLPGDHFFLQPNRLQIINTLWQALRRSVGAVSTGRR